MAEASSLTTIDANIASTQKDISSLKESLRITKQSIANIDPKYQANATTIKNLKTKELSDQTALDLAEGKLSTLQKERENITGPRTSAGDIRKLDNKVAENKANDEKAKANKTAVEETQNNPTVNKPAFNRTYNPLSAFSSYTYKLSLYLVTPEGENSFARDGVWHTTDMLLIAQSGGINAELDSKRADGFEYDFGIDNLTITTAVNSKASDYSGTTYEYQFTIYEPYGMTFPSRLVRAVHKMQEKTSMKRSVQHPMEALSERYLLVIRFYGYDEKGELMTVPTAGKYAMNKTDDTAAFERAFPVIIQTMSTRLDQKMTTYQVTAKAAGMQIGIGGITGSVGEQVAISGSTVGEILNTGPTSLAGIINAKEKAKSTGENRIQDLADEIGFKFEDFSEIEAAAIVDKNQYSPAQTPIVGVPGALNVTVRAAESGKGTTVSKMKREIQINANTPIVQVVENIISQSTYISDCLNIINDEQTQTVLENDKNYATNPSPKVLTWFNITPVRETLGFDEKRKTYAYKITYVITKYAIPYVRSSNIPNKDIYPGPSKIYNYWYTGKNEGILSYNIKYDNLYNNIHSLYGQAAKNADPNDPAPRKAMTSAGGDTTGKMPGTYEEVSSLKTWLLTPGDQVHASVSIIGDPDFLMTGPTGSYKMVAGLDKTEDAPINPNTGQVFIEIDFNQVHDFNHENGLMTPDHEISFWDYAPDLKRRTEGRMIHMLTVVKSKFSKGSFTQEFIDMSLPPFLKTQETVEQREQTPARGNSSAKSTPTQADIRKIDNKLIKPAQGAEDDNSYDPMGNIQSFSSGSSGDASREPPVFRGRGAPRASDNTNKTRTVGNK